jgi:soluble lytic murein transglycosylase
MGNHYWNRDQRDQYEPYYRRCYERFPGEPDAAQCHWRIAFASWMAREPRAKQMMVEHAAKWPASAKASAALYFAGRYQECIEKWPMSYYTVLSRRKIKATVNTAPDERFTPTAEAKARINRAKQLEAAALPEWSDFELQSLAEAQPFVAAMELAENASRRGEYYVGLRYVKSIARGYLNLPVEAAPQRFWKAAFPRPFAGALEKYCTDNGLDPHLVAGLIRQESEFNPAAVSRAKAYGLTQVLPSTGRELYRRLGLGSFHTSVLTNPDVNLRLGTRYLKQLNTSLGGNWEYTLAAYNAGKSRVDRWKLTHQYREPAEFIESIPFDETREYVQIVLRNADVYRRLYAH